MRRAVFLDRDGTLNRDLGYVHRPEDWQWLPGVTDALAKLKKAGWLLIVVSNQSGVGRGYFDAAQLEKLEKWANADLAPKGAAIDKWYYCPHLPDQGCSCRKPEPGLILKAVDEYDIDPAASWLLGDRLRDVQAGLAAGCRTGLLYNPQYENEWQACRAAFPCTFLWPALVDAARFILKNSS